MTVPHSKSSSQTTAKASIPLPLNYTIPGIRIQLYYKHVVDKAASQATRASKGLENKGQEKQYRMLYGQSAGLLALVYVKRFWARWFPGKSCVVRCYTKSYRDFAAISRKFNSAVLLLNHHTSQQLCSNQKAPSDTQTSLQSSLARSSLKIIWQ